DELWEILTLVTVVAVGGLGLLVAFVRGSGGGRTRTAPRPPRGQEARDGAVLAPDRPAGEVENRGGGVVVEPELEPTPTLERPESARGRLQRLRARLARSNSAIGNALLALLARGGLSEGDWED